MKKLLLTVAFLLAALLSGCVTTKQTVTAHDEQPQKPASKEKKAKVPCINNPEPGGNITICEDFEDICFWQAAGETDSKNYSIEADVSEEWCSETMRCGMWTFSSVPQNCYASFYSTSIESAVWEEATLAVADIYNTLSEPVSIRIAAKSEETILTEPVILGTGENTNVYFDLSHGLKDEHKNSVPKLCDGSQITEIAFRIENCSRGGTIYIDNIRTVR